MSFGSQINDLDCPTMTVQNGHQELDVDLTSGTIEWFKYKVDTRIGI